MDKISEYMKELKFDIEGNVFPSLIEVSKRFRDLAKIKHSDKGGDDAEFVKLYYAFKQIMKY